MPRFSCCFIGIALFACAAQAQPRRWMPPATRASNDRIVRYFDFDESRAGNFEDSPMGWVRKSGPGYPSYLTARFDRMVGHGAAPSLRLSVLGGSVLLSHGDGIAVRPRSRYRVAGAILPDGLVHARPMLSAYYVDAARTELPATRTFAQPADMTAAAHWRMVVLDLPQAPANAQGICIEVAVLQPAADTGSPRPIAQEDYVGGAWFDDIIVIRMPHATIECASSTGLFLPGEIPTLLAGVTDVDSQGIAARLSIVDENQTERVTLPLEIGRQGSAPIALPLPMLGPGWYLATLSVWCGSAPMSDVSTPFAVLPPALAGAAAGRSPVGVVLADPGDGTWTNTQHLILELGVGAVKLPIWTAHSTAELLVRGDATLDFALRALHGDGVAISAIMAAPPDILARTFDAGQRGLMDVLASPPNRWRAFLALPIARYGGLVNAWQIGPDSAIDTLLDSRGTTAIAALRAEIAPLAGTAGIVMPASCARMPPAELPVDIGLSFYVEESLSAANVHAQLRAIVDDQAMSGRVAQAYIDGVGRQSQHEPAVFLGNLAKRLVAARAAGVGQVFVRQPWENTAGRGQSPLPELLVIRAICGALKDCAAGERVHLADGVEAWQFPRADMDAVLVAWCDSERAGVIDRTSVLGEGAIAHDVMGRRLSATSNGLLHIGSSPVIVTHVKPEIPRWVSNARVDVPLLQTTREEQARRLQFSNPQQTPVDATLVLTAPAGMHVQPREFALRMDPNAQADLPVTIRLSANMPAGEYVIAGAWRVAPKVAAPPALAFVVRVGSPGLLSEAWADRHGDQLRIRQRVINRGIAPLDARATVVAPGAARQTRRIRELPPGESIWLEYALQDGGSLRGRKVRVSVESTDGQLRRHELLPPAP